MKVLNWGTKARFSALAFLFAASAMAGGPPPAGLYDNARGSPLVALIDSAQQTLDIEIYQMENPRVHSAILNALAAGVKVRIIQEPSPIGDPCNVFEDFAATDTKDCTPLKIFRKKVVAAGGTYLPFSKALCGKATTRGCVEHGKMAIVDAKAALLSTGNFNSTSLCDKRANPKNCNRDFSYIIHYGPAIQVLGSVFQQDLKGVPYDLRRLLASRGAADLTVSPYSMAPLVQFIRSAKSSLSIQEQYLKDPTMNAEIIAAAKRGVVVSVMVASVCSFGTPSALEADRWTQSNQAFEAAGIKVRAFPRAIKINGLPGYLHSKVFVVDGRTAWVGSVNGSTQAIGSNREFGVFFDGPRDIQLLNAVMDADLKNPNGETWQQSLKCLKDLG